MKAAPALAIALLLLAFVVPSPAGEAKGSSDTPEEGIKIYRLPGPARALEKRADGQSQKKFTGKVVAVDSARGVLRVRGKKFEADFVITVETPVMAGNGRIELSDIRIGESVTVNYAAEGGRNIAKDIVLRAVPAIKP